tara:strand:- start:448 stop:753 length:306 start_codon:yes stop_codon:yes gene_type:complete
LLTGRPLNGSDLLASKALWAILGFFTAGSTKCSLNTIVGTYIGDLVGGTIAVLMTGHTEHPEIRYTGKGEIGTRDIDGLTLPTLGTVFDAGLRAHRISEVR